MSSVLNFFKNQVAGVAGVINYGLTHLDQFSTAGDVIVVQHPDGTLHSTAFNVRFGKISVPRPQHKIVQIVVNGELIKVVMKLRNDGTAYFLENPVGHVLGPNGTPQNSPPRSPVMSNTSAPSTGGAGESLGSPNSRLPPLSLAAAAAADRADKGTPEKPNREQDGGEQAQAQTEVQQQPEEPIIIDEGSAVELARNNPEIRDLVTSIVGESRHLDDDDTTHAHNNNGDDDAPDAVKSPLLPKNNSPTTGSGGHSGPPPGHSRTRSFEGGSGGGLRLSKFASEDNLAAYQHLVETDDSFAALMKEMPAPAPAKPLTLAASAASLGSQSSPVGSPAKIDDSNNDGGDSPMKRDGTLDSTGIREASAPRPDQQQQQQSAAAAVEAAAPLPVHPPLPSHGSMVMDDEYVDDSSDDEYLVLPISPQVSSTAAPDGGLLDPAAAALPASASASMGGTAASGDALDGTLGGTSSGSSRHLKQTVTPGHNELVKFNLKDGCNTIKFVVYSTTLTRSTEVEARIFLWPYTAKVIVSDIDGTVTKSDVMGHLSALLRWDWTHPGLCDLYTNIHKNGYKMLYLTARSLCQSNSTRAYLESVSQDNQKLPDGPVFTATEKLFAALTQEIMKRSQIFKTECLNAVKAAFPRPIREPLYAGFGNRIGDSIAYEAVGIPLHKIFIIDESSVVHVCQVKRTYRDLAHLVDVTFPPVSGKIAQEASDLPIKPTSVAIVNGAVMPVETWEQQQQQREQELEEQAQMLDQQQQQKMSPRTNSADGGGGNGSQPQFPPPGVHLASSPANPEDGNIGLGASSNYYSAGAASGDALSCRSGGTPGANSATPVQGANGTSTSSVSPNVYQPAGSAAGSALPSPALLAAQQQHGSSPSLRDLVGTSTIHPTNSTGDGASRSHSAASVGGSGRGGAFPGEVENVNRSPSSDRRVDGGGASGTGQQLPPPLGASTTASRLQQQHQHQHHTPDLESSTMEEKVEFNNFNFWSMDPKSLTNATKDAHAATTTTAAVGTSSSNSNNNATTQSPATGTPAGGGSPATAVPVPAAGENATAGGDAAAAAGAAPAADGAAPQQGWLSWVVGRKA